MLNASFPRTLFFYDGAMEAINAFNIYAGALVKIYERNKSSKKMNGERLLAAGVRKSPVTHMHSFCL